MSGSKKVLSSRPIVYSTAKELWQNYASEKFACLKTTTNVNAYYDFIFAAGSVGYWLIHKKNEPNNNFYYQIFMSIYNNTKHYELDRSRFNVYVVDNQKSLFPTDGNGSTIVTSDCLICSDAVVIADCDGESDALQLYCRVHDENAKTNKNITLYEICKQVFNLFENMLNQQENNHD